MDEKIKTAIEVLKKTADFRMGQILVETDKKYINVYSINRNSKVEKQFYNTKLICLFESLRYKTYMDVDRLGRCFLHIYYSK